MREIDHYLNAPFLDTDPKYMLGTPWYIAPEVIRMTPEQCQVMSYCWMAMGKGDFDESS